MVLFPALSLCVNTWLRVHRSAQVLLKYKAFLLEKDKGSQSGSSAMAVAACAEEMKCMSVSTNESN